jgi:hypothetical protein
LGSRKASRQVFVRAAVSSLGSARERVLKADFVSIVRRVGDAVGPNAAVRASGVPALVTERAMEAWYHPRIA